jgi:hypothetical protein
MNRTNRRPAAKADCPLPEIGDLKPSVLLASASRATGQNA